jgi:hypothetical protein
MHFSERRMKHLAAIVALAAAAAACAAPAFAQSGTTLYRNNCAGSGCHSNTPDARSRKGESVDTIRSATKDGGMVVVVQALSDATLESIAAYIRSFNAGGGPPVGGGKLSLPTSLPFGNQAIGTTSDAKRVTATNTGTAAVSVTSVTSTNTEFRVAATTCAGSIAIGGTCTIDITFRPTDVGPRGGTVSVVSNGTGSPQGIAVSGDGSATAPPTGATVTIKEYFHAAFGHYFITASAAEIGLLDAGKFDGWSSTGRSFKAYQNQGAGTVAVCRFFTEAFAPKSSHFYAPRGVGCEDAFNNKDWQYEGDVFYAVVASDAGACPAGTQPIYRLYNMGQTGAPNHRYTNDPAVRSQMLSQNFQPEGKGAEGVGFCAPL